MNRTALILSAGLAGAAALLAAPRSSTDYAVSAEIADAGGGLSASTDYSHHGSFHSLNGVSTSIAGGDYALLHGYLGQLSDNTLPAAFVAWQTEHFGDPGLPEAAPEADPDHDGIGNIGEYAWGLDPDSGAQTPFDPGTNTIGLPVGNLDPSSPGPWVILMPQRHDGSVAYLVEVATDLTDWQPARATESPPVAIDATWDSVTVTVDSPTSSPRSQYRITALLR